MDEIILTAEEKMEKAIEAMEKKFATVRAGRANPAILDGVMVSYYGVDTPLKALATISVPEARTIMVKPFDRSSIGSLEKAIFEANIGLTPNNNGETITLNIPPLTEERRREFVKQVKAMAEEARIALRNIRQDANTHIKNADIPEDNEERSMEEIQKLTNEYNKKIDSILKVKEDELLMI